MYICHLTRSRTGMGEVNHVHKWTETDGGATAELAPRCRFMAWSDINPLTPNDPNPQSSTSLAPVRSKIDQIHVVKHHLITQLMGAIAEIATFIYIFFSSCLRTNIQKYRNPLISLRLIAFFYIMNKKNKQHISVVITKFDSIYHYGPLSIFFLVF